MAGLKLCTLLIPRRGWGGKRSARGRAEKGAQLLAAQGVRRALFPENFPEYEAFRKAGVREVDVEPLRRALIGPLAMAEAERRGLIPGGTAAFVGDRVTRELREAVLSAVPQYRYILLDAAEGEDALAEEIRRGWGAAVQRHPSAEQLEGADCLLLYDHREDLCPRSPICWASCSGEERWWPPIRVPKELRSGFPGELEETGLAAALWHRGILRFEDILGEIVG